VVVAEPASSIFVFFFMVLGLHAVGTGFVGYGCNSQLDNKKIMLLEHIDT
jgi:hypothetical protein